MEGALVSAARAGGASLESLLANPLAAEALNRCAAVGRGARSPCTQSGGATPPQPAAGPGLPNCLVLSNAAQARGERRHGAARLGERSPAYPRATAACRPSAIRIECY